MLKFLRIQLNDVILFKSASLSLDYNGVTVITGLNKDSILQQQTNAVGKSLILTCIANVMFRRPPLSKKKKDVKTLLSEKSKIILDFDKDGILYTIEQFSSGSTVKYTVLENGKNLELRTTPIAEEFISRLFPFSEEDWYSTMYIDGRRPLQFQMGSDIDRISWFTDVFRIYEYDHVRRKIKSKLDEIRQATSKIEELRLIIKDKRVRIKALNWNDTKDRVSLEKYKKIIDNHTLKLTIISNRITELNALLVKLERLTYLKETLSSLPNSKFNKTELKSYIQAHTEFEEYEEQSKVYTAKLSSYREAISELKEVADLDIESLEEQETGLMLTIDRLEDSLSVNSIARDAQSELLIKIAKLKEDISSLAPVKELRDIEEVKSKVLLLKKVEKLGKENTCPTCGSHIDLETTKKLLSELPTLKQIEDTIEFRRKKKELNSLITIPIVDGLEEKVVKIRKKLSSVNTLLAKVKEDIRNRKRYEKLKVRIDAIRLEKPNKPKIRYINDIPSKEDCYNLLSSLDERRRLEEQIQEIGDIEESEISLRKELESLNKERISLPVRLQGLNSKYNLLSSKCKVYEALLLEIEELESLLSKDKELISCNEDYKYLFEAFGNKGAKILHIRYICKALEDNLNRYSSVIFTEPILFKILVDVNKFDVFYTKKDVTSDIRTLSGSETRAFSLLLPLCLLSLLPKELRTNVLILDEMESNMSIPSRNIFLQEYLPLLVTIVPSIILTTPYTDIGIPNSRKLNIIKENNISTLRS